MLVNIDIAGDILIQAETDFERGYLQQFDGRAYVAYVKCGISASEVIGLKLRKTSEQEEAAKLEAGQVGEASANKTKVAIALLDKLSAWENGGFPGVLNMPQIIAHEWRKATATVC